MLYPEPARQRFSTFLKLLSFSTGYLISDPQGVTTHRLRTAALRLKARALPQVNEFTDRGKVSHQAPCILRARPS